MSTDATKTASFYADFGSLSALKRDAKANSGKALRETAQQFESLFTQMMLKSMREASFGDELTGSSEMDFYQGMYDQQLSVQLSKGKGLGLADLLVQQLSRSGLVQGGESTESTQSSPAVNISAQPYAPSATKNTTTTGSDATTDAAATTSSNWRPTSRDEFVRDVWPHAQQAADQLGVDASTLVAHAALETGWGQHVPCNADGSSSFNLFGIKAGSRWSGDTALNQTAEYEDGQRVQRVESFRSYTSPAECFADYAALLDGGQRYAGARDAGSNAQQFAQGLQSGGYATDPAYASKLQQVAASVRSLLGQTAQVSDSSAVDTGRGAS